ncbi:hypothetical protein DFH11DRAFT_1547185 [Phellopilus nigrolimitatus]|nr:hypothetical protein DFH11DRAFT_1547185 [Phellopilus nigrolimitatus]
MRFANFPRACVLDEQMLMAGSFDGAQMVRLNFDRGCWGIAIVAGGGGGSEPDGTEGGFAHTLGWQNLRSDGPAGKEAGGDFDETTRVMQLVMLAFSRTQPLPAINEAPSRQIAVPQIYGTKPYLHNGPWIKNKGELRSVRLLESTSTKQRYVSALAARRSCLGANTEYDEGDKREVPLSHASETDRIKRTSVAGWWEQRRNKVQHTLSRLIPVGSLVAAASHRTRPRPDGLPCHFLQLPLHCASTVSLRIRIKSTSTRGTTDNVHVYAARINLKEKEKEVHLRCNHTGRRSEQAVLRRENPPFQAAPALPLPFFLEHSRLYLRQSNKRPALFYALKERSDQNLKLIASTETRGGTECMLDVWSSCSSAQSSRLRVRRRLEAEMATSGDMRTPSFPLPCAAILRKLYSGKRYTSPSARLKGFVCVGSVGYCACRGQGLVFVVKYWVFGCSMFCSGISYSEGSGL